MKINRERLKENILKVGEIGRTKEGGITRLAFSKEYEQALKVLIKLMKAAGLVVKIDGLKDVFGRRKGENDDLPSIMIGSHLDTVRNGGLFDGNLGVIAALECINYLNDHHIATKHPIEIVAFNAEEGNELGGTFASRVMVGLQDPEEEGLEEKLSLYGLTKRHVVQSIREPDKIGAFLELHIEQGADLYTKGIPIGVVEGIAGITRYKIAAVGEANHAGTTPMALRKDAMTGAARLILEIDAIAKGMGNPFVATVGTLEIFPGSVNVIPGTVEFVLELRDLDQTRIEEAVFQIKKAAKNIEGIHFDFYFLINKPPVMLNPGIVNIIEDVCENLKIHHQKMASGAGHDAKAIATKIPTGMIFVPSREGKSHCKEEWTDWQDIERGVEVLINTVLKIDRQL